MHSPLLGEFLGTMILILLGDGVVAAVVAEAFESRRQRLDGHHRRLGLCRNGRRLHRHCLRWRRQT